MNKLLLSIITLTLTFFSLEAQIDISVARGMGEGSTVTIQGIATNGPGLGIIRYIQDDTGAVAAYPGAGSAANFPDMVQRGDLVQLTGVLKIYNGLLEIDPINSFSIISSGNALPAALEVNPNGINEENEAKLLKVSGVVFDAPGSVFSVGTYGFSANGESSIIYVRSNHVLVGTTIPSASVNLTGLSSEFNGAYQLLLRDADDIEIADDFYITSSVIQSNINSTGFTVSWETNAASSSSLRYGTTLDMNNTMDDGGSTTNHSVSLTSLDPAQFYYVQVVSDNGTTEVSSTPKLFSTASNSSGTMLVYFNNPVNGSFSDGNQPYNTSPAALEAAIINRINTATTSIDASIYNNSRHTIVEALANAYNNGIQVRYIADTDTGNLGLQDPTPPFPIIKGNTEGLMHNKFFVFDVHSQMNSWVIMGSTNLTDNNLASDFNNMVFIQDQTIAKAYTIEFEEMWGSSDQAPGIFNVKFGPAKTDNTPHLFNVNGVMVESYFSPSDNTTISIVNAVRTAEDDFQFAILTFTNNELGAAVVDLHNDGVPVRGIIDNINDNGGEYDYLIASGVNVSPDNNTVQTHHKYCIIDATNPASDPQVVTGSHNWSASADTRNDENTLIFHDAAIANIFLQEFEARWCEATGGTNCITSTVELNEIVGFEAVIYPNPASDKAQIKMNLAQQNDITISLWNTSGQLLQSTILRKVQGEFLENILVNPLSAGTYILTFKVEDKVAVRRLQVVD